MGGIPPFEVHGDIFHVLYKFDADLAMVSQLEGSESAPKAPEIFVFSRIISVFFTTKIRLGGKRVKNTFSSVLGRRRR